MNLKNLETIKKKLQSIKINLGSLLPRKALNENVLQYPITNVFLKRLGLKLLENSTSKTVKNGNPPTADLYSPSDIILSVAGVTQLVE